MENKKRQAINIIKEFCTSYYKKRDVEKSLSYLSKDIFWFDTSKNSQVFNIEELRIKFLLEIAIIPSRYKIINQSEISYKITDDVYNVHYNIKVINKKKNIEFAINIISTITFIDDIPKIASLKFEYTYPKDINYTSYINGGILTAQFESRNYISIKSFNNHFLEIFSISPKKSKELKNTNLFGYIHGGDLALFKHQFFSDKSMNAPHCYKCRIKFSDSYSSVIVTTVSKKEENKTLYYMVLQPINYEEQIGKDIEEPLSTKKLIDLGYMNHENLFSEKFPLIKANDTFAKLLGYSTKELNKKVKLNYFSIIYNEDRTYVKEAYSKLNNIKHKNYIAYRLLTKNNQIIWVKENLFLSNKKSKGLVIKAIVEEINYLNNKEEQANALISQNEFDSKFLIIDFVKRRFETEIFENSRIKFTNKYVSNLPNSLIEKNVIYKDDNKSFIEFFNKALKMPKNSWVGRINLKNNKIGWYQINSYTLFNNKMPIKALCLITNINDIKNILVKFDKHQELLKIIISDYDFIGEYDSYTEQPLFMYSPKSQKDFIENYKENNIDFLIYNVIHKDYVHLLIEERNKTLNHSFNGVMPENNEIIIKYRSLSARFEGYQWGKIKYVYHFDKNTKHLCTIVFIKKQTEF